MPNGSKVSSNAKGMCVSEEKYLQRRSAQMETIRTRSKMACGSRILANTEQSYFVFSVREMCVRENSIVSVCVCVFVRVLLQRVPLLSALTFAFSRALSLVVSLSRAHAFSL